MSGGRRYLAAVLVAMLLIPSLGLPVAPYETQSAMEHRVLQSPPPVPRTAAEWAALPRRLDAWFSDHLAWRGAMVRALFAVQAGAGLRGSNSLEVVRGKDDWLLLYPGLLGVTGGETDRAGAERYGAFVCDVAGAAKAHGAAFLFAPAPSTAEIYPEALPDWIARGSPTQPERVMQAARACGAPTLDLRPAMLAAKSGQRLYQHHDSHWTNAGALAAFNGMAQALGKPWTIDPAALNWRPGKPLDSDLVRLAGAVDLPQELDPEPPEGAGAAPSGGKLTGFSTDPYPPPFLVAEPGAAPRVLVIGDSYTSDYLGPYFHRAGASFAWIHHAQCRFDRRIFDRVKPDIVVLMPASRLENCR